MRLRKRNIAVDELGIAVGEYLVAAAMTVSGRSVAATSKAFYPGPGTRLKWSGIAAASWQEPFLLVDVADAHGRPSERLRIELADGAPNLAAAVHDRVTASVIITERCELPCGAKALFTAREDSDNGTIGWAVVFDAGVNADDPVVRAEATEKLTGLRDSLGI